MLSGDTGPSDCEVSFRVLSAPQFPSTPIPLALTATPIVVSIPAKVVDEHAFHQNVPDVLFDYDKWDIRSDGESTLKQAAAYLNAHPELHVMVGGYSDERGGTAYNIMLGLKRANAVRDRLLAAGVDPERVQVVSYGKEVQICSSASEQCWQLNRRAAFMIQK
jgi:peptidoglycan-associated lipoprotein